MQKRQFRVYHSPKRSISSHFQLQASIKKNPKTLKELSCKEISLYDRTVNHNVTESPKLCSFAKLLKNSKSISFVYIRIETSRLLNFQRILLALKNLQCLSTLHLYSPKARSTIQKAYQSFILCTKSLKHLTDWNSHPHDTYKVTSPRRALHYIAPFRLLTDLSLKLHSVNWLTDLTWRSFSYHLPFLTSLRSLDLALNFGNGFTQKSALYLFAAFSKLHQLTSLEFTPIGCQSLDFQVLRFLFENLKDLVHLQDLTLRLETCQNLKLDNQELLATGLALLNPSSLRKFSVEFYSGFSDSDLQELFVVMQRFSLLTNLSLKFSDNDQITAKSLSGLPVALSQLQALQALDFSISNTIDNRLFLEMISACLGNLKELVSLRVDIWVSPTIDNTGVKHLFSQLPSLLKLQSLELYLGSHSRLDEGCIESLAQTLRDLPGLKNLLLNWKSDGKITNKAYGGLIESFGYLRHLRELSLDIPVNVSKETLEAMRACLKSLENLHNIFLCFQVKEEQEDEEKEIVENYCDDFVRLLDSMEALTGVVIFFDGFKFSKRSRKIVAKSLKAFRLCS